MNLIEVFTFLELMFSKLATTIDLNWHHDRLPACTIPTNSHATIINKCYEWTPMFFPLWLPTFLLWNRSICAISYHYTLERKLRTVCLAVLVLWILAPRCHNDWFIRQERINYEINLDVKTYIFNNSVFIRCVWEKSNVLHKLFPL